MRRHFCTYFDHRYLALGLVLHASLARHGPDNVLWVLCLSDECERALAKLSLPGIRPISLAQLEAFDPDLAAIKHTRSRVEYYFTCSPCLPRYVFHLDPTVELVTYLDSDLYFFADPEVIFAELAGCSVGITPHRFSPKARKTHGKYGEYNVGLLTFRRDDAGIACLEWWRNQCLEWCYDRLDGRRYADQKYLDEFERRFHGVCSLTHPGINLAPWNIAVHTVGTSANGPTVDGKPLVFFHFQGARRIARHCYDSNLSGYGARLSTVARESIYLPYLTELAAMEDMLIREGILAEIEPSARREAHGLLAKWRRFKRGLLEIHARMLGNVVQLKG